MGDDHTEAYCQCDVFTVHLIADKWGSQVGRRLPADNSRVEVDDCLLVLKGGSQGGGQGGQAY